MATPALELEDFLKALASENRRRILELFADGQERTVNQVAGEANIGQSTASEQLALLRRSGLLRARREGREVYYSADGTRANAGLRQLAELITRCCPFRAS